MLRQGEGMRLPPPGDQEEFYEALQMACRTDGERAVVMLLWRTGMHASTLANRDFTLYVEGDVHWRRPKTRRLLNAQLSFNEAEVVTRCLTAGSLPTNRRTLARWVARIGERAGHSGICPLALRHSRAIWLLDSGMPVNRVAGLLGCSYGVLERHYAQIEDARLVQ